MDKPIRILIADDHMVVRQGIKTMLDPKKDLILIGEAVDGIEAVEKTIALNPDVILIDLIMPRKSGMEAIAEIVQKCPNTHILVLTSFSEEDKVIAAIRAGAHGYILKDSSPQELVQAIHLVHEGELWLYPSLAPKIVNRLIQPRKNESEVDNLTEREKEVLQLIAKGLTNLEISEILSVSEGTIRFHINHILAKIDLSNRTQAALYALRNGIASLY